MTYETLNPYPGFTMPSLIAEVYANDCDKNRYSMSILHALSTLKGPWVLRSHGSCIEKYIKGLLKREVALIELRSCSVADRFTKDLLSPDFFLPSRFKRKCDSFELGSKSTRNYYFFVF